MTDNAPDLRAPSPDAASLLCAVTDIYRNLCTEDGERIDTAISEWQRAALATPSSEHPECYEMCPCFDRGYQRGMDFHAEDRR